MRKSYLVYNTQTEAETAERIIFEAGKSLASLEGYATNSAIYGKRLGVSDHSTGKTLYWDGVTQRFDGKWVILHPAHHELAQSTHPVTVAAFRSLLDAMTQANGGPLVVEQEESFWWQQESE